MDEIRKTGSANNAHYGEEQRNAFVEWLRTTAEKADEMLRKSYGDGMASFVLSDYLENVGNLYNAEQKRGKLFPLEEQEMSLNGRVYELDAFKSRLAKALEDNRTSLSAYPVQLDQFPQIKEFEDRLQAEINAVQAGLAAIDPTLAADDIPAEPEVAEPTEEIKQNEPAEEIKQSEPADEINLNESAEQFDYAKFMFGDDDPVAKTMEEQAIAPTIQKNREIIARSAKLLKDSKTLVNSKEYCDLIDLMEKVGAGKIEKIPGKNTREQFAQELYAIHAQTEKYLAHKAKDGVKKNAYRKLLAVEKASSAIARAARDLGSVTVSTGAPGETRNLEEIPISLSSRLQGRPEELNSLKSKEYYHARAKELKANNESLQQGDVSKNIIADCIKSVDDCMGKIILKAEENGDQAAVHTLAAMKQSFLDDPFPVVKETAPKIMSAEEQRVL